MTEQKPALFVAIVLAAAVVLAALPLVLPPFYVRVGQLMIYSAGLAVAWTILGGFAGYASFGHAAFIGVGAFAAGLVEDRLSGLPVSLMLPIGLLVGGFACAILSAAVAYPILRLRGTFFAIAMLGVCHVCAELNNNLDVLQGSLGLNFPAITPAGWDPATFFYELYLAAGVIVFLIAWQIRRSRFGAGLLSIREDEDTARMLGVPTERYKTMMFVLSAVLTGIFGIIYAWSLGYITTGSVYRTDFSLNMIVYSLLGGMGTLIGPIIGSFLMVVLTQVLLGKLLDVHMMFTGILLVAMVLLAPRGLVGFVRDFRERRRGRAS